MKINFLSFVWDWMSDLKFQSCMSSKGQKELKRFFQADSSKKNVQNNFTLLQGNLKSTCFDSFFGGN